MMIQLCARIRKLIAVVLFASLLGVPAQSRSKPAPRIGSLAISRDARVLAVVFGDDTASFLYRIDVSTGVAARLTAATSGTETSPTFSPDGKRIASAYWPGGEAPSRIVIANIDGSDSRQWSPADVADLSPVFSPDNKTIVFSRAQFVGGYSPIAQPHPHDWALYASNLDGTNIRQITNERFYSMSMLSISPDGEKIVVVTETLYTSQRLTIYSLTRPGLPLSTFQPRFPNELSRKHPIYASPNYLPDGTILFLAADNHISYDVYRLNPETGSVDKLIDKNGYATDLTVAADGNTAAFLKWRRTRLGDIIDPKIYLLDMSNNTLKALPITGLP
jgi:Tol biopolymer transport system component